MRSQELNYWGRDERDQISKSGNVKQLKQNETEEGDELTLLQLNWEAK